MGDLELFLQCDSAVLDDIVVEDQLALHWVVGEKLLAFLELLGVVLEVIGHRLRVDVRDGVPDRVVLLEDAQDD